MATTAGLWSCVGSAGAVNPPDMGKVVLVGSVVQLGATAGVVTASPQVAARSPGPGAGPGTQAVIRYGVTALDGASSPNPEELVVSLSVFCRPGNGQIAAQLVQVSTNSGPVPGVVETTLVELQAKRTSPNLFTLQTVSGAAPGLIDFQANAYYVEVVLTAPGDVVTEYPPAVSAIQLSFSTPSSGGGGNGGGGGGPGKGGGTTQKQ